MVSIKRWPSLRSAESAAKALYGLPWHRWRPLDPKIGQRFLEALTEIVVSTKDAKGRQTLVAGYALFAVLRMLQAGLDPSALTAHIDVWRALLEDVRVGNEDLFGDSRRAGFLVEKALAATPGAPTRTSAEVFAAWFPERDAATRGGYDQREERWGVLAESLRDSDELLPQLRAELELLVRDDKLIRHYCSNPHLSYQPVALLAEGLKRVDELRSDTRRCLLRLLEVAPNYMSAASDAVDRELWDEHGWDELMHIIVTACGGSGARRSSDYDPGITTQRQLSALELFGQLGDSKLRETTPFVWNSLQGLALSVVNDDRILVANRAAFSVVSVARGIEVSTDAPFYAKALGSIAADPRVPVRSAVAHAGPGLSLHARSELIRKAASSALLVVEQDDNAQVRSLLDQARAVSRKE